MEFRPLAYKAFREALGERGRVSVKVCDPRMEKTMGGMAMTIDGKA